LGPARLIGGASSTTGRSLVGPNADKVIGFFVGVFAPVLGVLTTAVAM